MNKYTILCIDDNENNLFALNALLSTQVNLSSLEALNAKGALDILLKKRVDLILCDIQMPDVDGFELAKLIKSNSKTKNIPIIFVTAIFKDEEFIRQGFELGVIDYIKKPIDDKQLLNKVSFYLNIFDEKSKILQREKLYYEIAQSVEDGIFTIDDKGNNTFINKRALSLLGFKENQLLGNKIHNYIHYKDHNNMSHLEKDCSLYNVLKTQESYNSKNEILVKKDGSLLEVTLRATPLFERDKVSGVVVIFKAKN